jgi:2-iminobutanoate/2-iminopropanoate deaminase
VPKRYQPAGVHPPTPTYCHVIEDERSGLIYVSGQVGLTPEGALVGPDMASQLRQILLNYDAVLHALDLTRAAFLKRTVFVTDMEEYLSEPVSSQMRAYFSPNPSASSLIGVTRLLGAEIRIEIEAVLTRDQ